MIAHEEEHTLSDARRRSTSLILVAIWFALCASLAEFSIWGVRKYLLDKFIHVSPHVVWLNPSVNICIYVLAGLILLLIARRWPRVVSMRVATFFFALLAFSSPLLMFIPTLPLYTVLCLAAGLAVQTSRLIPLHSAGFHAFVRQTVKWGLGGVVGMTVGVFGWQLGAERYALAQLPPAVSHAPNVLLIVLDTVRAKNLSLYGYNRPTTPALERLAKTGVLFEQAFSTAPWTLPAHASMFTGRFPGELSTNWSTALDTLYPTLAEVFSAHGYLTAGFVANTWYCSYETGLSRGFMHYEDYVLASEHVILHSSLGRFLSGSPKIRRLLGYYDIVGRKSAAQINRNFLAWLSQREQRPFFAFLNYFDAHDPYLPPPPYDEKFGPQNLRKKSLIRYKDHGGAWLMKRQFTQDALQQELDAYDGAIAYLDSHVGSLVAALQHRNLLDNTLIIITSDHGEQFGEHGLFDHANSLYMPLLHVPLLMVLPGRIPAGITVSEAVSLRDLPSTIVDLLQSKWDTRFPGNSLAQHWTAAQRLASSAATPMLAEVSQGIRRPPEYPVSKGDMKSLLVGNYHYIRTGDNSEELYDVERDPFEEHDLTRSPAEHQTVERFRFDLDAILTQR